MTVLVLGTGPARAQTALVGTADLGVIQIGLPTLDGTISLTGVYGGPASDGWHCNGALTEVTPGAYQGQPACSDSTGGSEGGPPSTTFGAMPSSFTANVTVQVSGSSWQLQGTMGWASLQCSGVVDPLTGGGVQELQGSCTAG